MNLFVISDKQGAGKTFISAGLASTMQSLGYSAGYYKPVQTSAYNTIKGIPNSHDVTFVKKNDPNIDTVTSYVFKADAIPMLAAQNEEKEIKPEVLVKDFLRLRKNSEVVIVESCGGLYTPLSPELQIKDFVNAVQLPVIIVAEASHDVFDNIVMLVNCAKHAGLVVRGIIINKFLHTLDLNVTNLQALCELYTGIPVVGVIPFKTDVSPSELIDLIVRSVDLDTVFGVKIPKLNSLQD
ncbi:MAG: dethiobiotin synthase [Candidatus Gastranaerophilaceae bacterium]